MKHPVPTGAPGVAGPPGAPVEGYCFDPEDLEALRGVLRVIYDDKPLAGDRRRDLANRMDAILGRVVSIFK